MHSGFIGPLFVAKHREGGRAYSGQIGQGRSYLPLQGQQVKVGFAGIPMATLFFSLLWKHRLICSDAM